MSCPIIILILTHGYNCKMYGKKTEGKPLFGQVMTVEPT